MFNFGSIRRMFDYLTFNGTGCENVDVAHEFGDRFFIKQRLGGKDHKRFFCFKKDDDSQMMYLLAGGGWKSDCKDGWFDSLDRLFEVLMLELTDV